MRPLFHLMCCCVTMISAAETVPISGTLDMDSVVSLTLVLIGHWPIVLLLHVLSQFESVAETSLTQLRKAYRDRDQSLWLIS